jgi:uncharacterized membrane protein AbrB (regulator of aidB expression)
MNNTFTPEVVLVGLVILAVLVVSSVIGFVVWRVRMTDNRRSLASRSRS